MKTTVSLHLLQEAVIGFSSKKKLSGVEWSVGFVGKQHGEGEGLCGCGPTVEDILSVWGLEPMKQNLANVTLPSRSHAGRDGEENMRWSPVEGLSHHKREL